MHRRILIPLAALLLAVPAVRAQEKQDDELAFVQQLRAQNFPDLALEYLEKRLAKNPKYAGDLPLEIAQTKLVLARKDTDAGNRITLYNQIRSELEDFVAKNPAHPRVATAKLQVAQVSAEQGKAQLVRRLTMPEDDAARKEELTKAQTLLGAAIKVFEALAEQLKTDEAKNRSAFERGVLLTSQGKAFLNKLKQDKQAGDVFKAAIILFDDLTDKLENKDPLKPLSFAWVGRAYALNAEPAKARPKFTEARNTKDRDANRLADYFEMLITFEKEGNLADADRKKILEEATKWYITYPSYRASPEGQGVQYVLAKMLFEAGLKVAGVPCKTAWDQARGFVRSLESDENDYTELARQLKIDMLAAEGDFSADPKTLITFDSLSTRGSYELRELYKNTTKFGTDEAKKKQQEHIVDILKLAFKKAETARNINENDLGLAYFYLTGVQLTLKRYADAFQTGKEFAEKHPRNKRASECAIYAAEALMDKIKNEDGDNWSDESMPDRKKLYDFGEFMAGRWPKDKAGDFGRYLVYNHLIKEPLQAKGDEEKKAEQKMREAKAVAIGGDLARYEIGSMRARENKYYEAILMLREIQPNYPRYVIAQSQVGLFALKVQEENDARKKKKEPPVLLPGDKREMREVALEAFERIPDPPATDADATRFYLIGKIALGKLLYTQKKYDALVALTANLLQKVGNIKGEEDQKAFKAGINSLRLSADYGRAYDANQAGKPNDVVAILDPLVTEIKAGTYPDVKENQPLLSGLMGMAMRANLQIERGQKANEIFAIWNTIEEERLEIKAKQDAEKLEAGIAGLAKKQDLSEDDKKLLDQQKALLKTLKDPAEADKALKEALTQHRSNVLLQTFAEMKKQIDKLRKAGDKEKLDKTIGIVSSLLAQEKGDGMAMKPGQRYLLAQCYHSIGRNEQAAGLLRGFPRAAANATPQDVALWKRAQVLLIDSLRLQSKDSGDAKLFDEARKLLDGIMQPTEEDKKKKQAGWGKRDVNALKEEVQVLMDQKTWIAAANRCNDVLKIIGPQVQKNEAMRDHYFEVGGFFVVSMSNLALTQTDMTKRERYLTSAANFFIKVVKNYEEQGTDETKERFRSFLKDHYLVYLKTKEASELKDMIVKLAPDLDRLFAEK